jgi:hypothetical protein
MASTARRWCLPLALLLGGCGSTSAPEAGRSLRPVPLTSALDQRAYDVAEGAGDRLDAWCKEALKRRDRGEELPIDDPVLDGRAGLEVERIRLTALPLAESRELIVLLRALADAHEARLAVLRLPGRHKPKRYVKTDSEVKELAFGLRRWRTQR